MVFTSIAIVSRDNLNRKVATLESKTHIDTIEDVESFLTMMKGVI